MSTIPATGNFPLCVNLAYYEIKGIRITPQSVKMHKNTINKVGKHDAKWTYQLPQA